MSWDWAHFKAEGFLPHVRRSAKLSGRLIVAGLGMIVHMLVPFWQQPRWLSGCGIRDTLDAELKTHQEADKE